MVDDEMNPEGRSGDDAAFRDFQDRREPVFNIPGPILFIVGLCVAVQLVRMYVLSPRTDEWFLIYASFIPARFTQAGGLGDPLAWLTTVSYSFMHGGLLHITVNMVWLLAFGSPVAARIGAWRTAVFWVLTAVAAAMTHLAFYSDSMAPLVGASGSISGMMAAAARYGFERSGHSRSSAFAGPLLPIVDTLTRRSTLVFVAAWFALNLLAGFVNIAPGPSAPIAWQAHIGGFVVGFFAIALFDRPPPHPKRGA